MKRLDAAVTDLVGELGERATIVQFSSGFCAPCRASRTMFSRVVDRADGVNFAEIDLAFHPELGDLTEITSTPTTLYLGPDGEILTRFSGVPRLAAARELLDTLAPEQV